VVASRYEILGFLGEGGMGRVWRAHDKSLEEDVALKVLRAGADEDLVRRFRSEVKLARKVRHKNVCAIHDYGEDGERLYISMALVEGTDLRRVLRERGALPWEEGFDLALQVGEGLSAIHEAGVIHRDLKPANVMKDGKGVVRLMDFGIAKLGGAGAPDLTGENKSVGTPEYMSPEQVMGGAGLDLRSDLYSLGIMVYEFFVGRVPFRADTPWSTMRKHVEEEPPLDGPEADALPSALVPVLRRALAKSAEDRYPSCAAMLDALKHARAALAEQSTDEVPGAKPSSGERPTRHVPGLSRGPVPYPPQARLLVPALVRALKHPDSRVRLGAADALIRTPDESAQPALREALGDEDAEVRRRVREALQPFGAASPEEKSVDEPAPPAATDGLPTRSIDGPRPALGREPLAAVLVSPDPGPAPALPAPPVAFPPLPNRSTGRLMTILVAVALAILLWLLLVRPPHAPPTAVAALATPPVSPSAVDPSPAPPFESPPTAIPVLSPSGAATAAPLPSARPTSAPARSDRGRPSATPATLASVAAPEPTASVASVPLPAAPSAEPTPLPSTLDVASSTEPERTAAPSAPGPTAGAAESATTPPVCLKCPPPDYPMIALRLKRQGIVVLRVLIDENGRVKQVLVVTGVEQLTESAVVAVRKWTYRPASRQGAPVQAWLEVPIRFDLPR
jgi:TonB family protein